MDRIGHFGGALLLFFAILSLTSAQVDSLETLGLSIVAAAIAMAMSTRQDSDMKVIRGKFHRTWVTHSLLTVIIASAITYMIFDTILMIRPLSYYVTLSVFSATLSHVVLDSATKKGVPMFGPIDNTMRGIRWFRGSDPVLNYLLLVSGILMAFIYYGFIRLGIPDFAGLL